jgi:hypothetical protein
MHPYHSPSILGLRRSYDLLSSQDSRVRRLIAKRLRHTARASARKEVVALLKEMQRDRECA